MYNILREFYCGNIQPSDQLKPESQIYEDALIDTEGGIKRLKQKLLEQDKELVDELMQAHTSKMSEEANTAFTDGFTLGSLFIFEVMQRGKRYEQLNLF